MADDKNSKPGRAVDLEREERERLRKIKEKADAIKRREEKLDKGKDKK